MLNYEWLEKHKKVIAGWFLLVISLLAIQLYSRISARQSYVRDDGTLVAIERESLDEAMMIPLELEIETEGVTRIYDVTLSLQGVEKGDAEQAVEKQKAEKSETASDVDAELIAEIVETLESRDEQVLALPHAWGKSKLTWNMPSMGDTFLLLLLFPLGVAYLYRHEADQLRNRDRARKDAVRKALPAFNDQILLLMNSGLIFHDAFLRIADNYRERKRNDDFQTLVIQIVEDVETSGKSMIAVMEESKKEIAIREYSRMVNIIADNQIKGVDLKEKLESESRLLWESRKAMALQKGKEMETKMTFPLAGLLFAVVIIAGVPAMMSM